MAHGVELLLTDGEYETHCDRPTPGKIVLLLLYMGRLGSGPRLRVSAMQFKKNLAGFCST